MFGLRKNHLTNLVKYDVKEEFLNYQSARIIEGENSKLCNFILRKFHQQDCFSSCCLLEFCSKWLSAELPHKTRLRIRNDELLDRKREELPALTE
jgi:hypothetical protein